MKSMPAVTLAAAACADEPAQRAGDQEATSSRQDRAINSDSRLDTALIDDADHTGSMTPAVRAAAAAPFRRYEPALPPVSAERRIQVHWRSMEVPLRISPSLAIAAWTFEGNVPGPILHVRQGDTIDFTLTNEGDIPHSMDFHAAQIDPRTAFRSVPKGESVSYTFQPRHAGAFLYHCGTAPVLMHIGAGMYGAAIVDPPEPLPPAREFVLVQSEYYLAGAETGLASFDYRKATNAIPDYVVLNGRPDQYIAEPIRVRRGDRVRFYVLSAGPTHPCNFHVVGEQFDAVYSGAPPENPLRGVQTHAVPPGGGMVFDLIADIPGEFPFVNHGFG
ncbi:MAG: multicopper oxidase domain-containing protein, partial [Planctomycetaceae bacterium]